MNDSHFWIWVAIVLSCLGNVVFSFFWSAVVLYALKKRFGLV